VEKEDLLSFVESGKEKPYTKESAFIAAMVYLEEFLVLLLIMQLHRRIAMRKTKINVPRQGV